MLAQNFRITREDLLFSSEIIVDTSKINKRPAIAKGTRPLTHSFQCTNKSQYCITSMDSENLSSQALIIIGKIILGYENSHLFTLYSLHKKNYFRWLCAAYFQWGKTHSKAILSSFLLSLNWSLCFFGTLTINWWATRGAVSHHLVESIRLHWYLCPYKGLH